MSDIPDTTIQLENNVSVTVRDVVEQLEPLEAIIKERATLERSISDMISEFQERNHVFVTDLDLCPIDLRSFSDPQALPLPQVKIALTLPR